MNPLLLLALCCAAGIAQAAGPMPAEHAIRLDGPVRWDYAWVDPPAHRLYVGHHDEVDVIDTRSERLVQRLQPTPGVHGAAAADELGRVFTSNGGSGEIGVFDLVDGKPLSRVKAGQNPDAIVYEPVTQRVFAFNGRSRDATVVDGKRLAVLQPALPLGGKPEYAVADGHGQVYVNLEDTAEMAQIDAATMRVTQRWPLAPCEGPSGLAIDPRGRLYSVCDNGLMVISDPRQGKVIGQATIGRGPDGVAWLDGRAYSANGRDGTLSIVAEAADGRFTTVATRPTAPGARTIAADPALHTLYTPTASFEPEPDAPPTAGPHRRRTPIPGSFRVLVLPIAPAAPR